ncbi:HEAT repeat domain-containing protein [Desulfatibacillum aliphaticivorans]|uniref:HEAT repeat domain-containing protein n=1 Tax=Desulfatibacillum aliphaticivorans TaxID=218208 RepID=UPI0004211B92|nr:HEAT repeat domain-containing protein [Desulfatibacillum aliphaticivorans]
MRKKFDEESKLAKVMQTNASDNKKCFIVTADEMQAFKGELAHMGRTMVVCGAIVGASLYVGGCATSQTATTHTARPAASAQTIEAARQQASQTTDPRLLSKLANHPSSKVRFKAAENPHTPSKALLKLVRDENEYIRIQAIRNPGTPRESLLQIAQDENTPWPVRRTIAEYTQDDALMRRLAQSSDEAIRFSVAYNKDVSPGILAMLARDKTDSVRKGVAAQPGTPFETLLALAKDPVKDVREDALEALIDRDKDGKTNATQVQAMAQSSNVEIRKQAARSAQASDQVLEYLAKDQNEYVRACTAANKNLPVHVKNFLVKDESSLVIRALYGEDRERAKKTQDPELLTTMASHPYLWVRVEVANNWYTPEDVLRKLALDPNGNVRKKVAQKLKTPQDVIAALCKDSSSTVRDAAQRTLAYHKDTEQSLRSGQSGGADPMQDSKTRLAEASNENTGEAALKKLAKDPDENVRAAVIKNPSSTIEILALLVKDSSPKVKKALEERIAAMSKSSPNKPGYGYGAPAYKGSYRCTGCTGGCTMQCIGYVGSGNPGAVQLKNY